MCPDQFVPFPDSAPPTSTTATRPAPESRADEPEPTPAPDGEAPFRMPELIGQLETFLDLPDTRPFEVAVAAAATTRLVAEEAAWVLIVAAPSAGKTEAVNLLDGVSDGRLNDVSVGGLLAWSNNTKPKPTGLLARLPNHALVTFGDLSSLLASADHRGRGEVFGLLRRAYDGYVSRDVAPRKGAVEDQRLEWSGRLTVVAAVTNAIDRYAAHNDALGPRWLYIRIPERSLAQRRAAAKMARRSGVREERKRAMDLATEIITEARDRARWTAVPDQINEAIDDAVEVTCWGRATVPRNGYGRREIEDVASVEEPTRLTRQTQVLARGLLALGYPTPAVIELLRRVALDSMPIARLAALRAVVANEGANTTELARDAALHRHVAKRNLEELQVIGVLDNLADGPDDSWVLAPDDGRGQLVRKVITDG